MTCFSTWSYSRFMHLLQYVISKFVPSPRNSRICKWNHCETISWTSVTFWNLHRDACSGKSTRCEVRALQWIIKTFPYKMPQNKAANCWAVWGLGIKWLASFWSSAGACWWSHIPNCCGSVTGCLRVFPFTKPRILCWRLHLLITRCEKRVNLQDNYVEK